MLAAKWLEPQLVVRSLVTIAAALIVAAGFAGTAFLMMPRYSFSALPNGMLIRSDRVTGEAVACMRARCSPWAPPAGLKAEPLFPDR